MTKIGFDVESYMVDIEEEISPIICNKIYCPLLLRTYDNIGYTVSLCVFNISSIACFNKITKYEFGTKIKK
jgi:uncharacterized protein (UPF0212 family)